METFERDGIWWIPGKKDEWMPGTLKYSRDDGLTLSLSGFGHYFNSGDKLKMIVGTTYDSINVTLYNCFQLSTGRRIFSCNAPSMKTNTRYLIKDVYYNADFSAKRKITFKKVDVSYYHLDEWIGISGFKTNADARGGKAIIEYERPSSVKLCECDLFEYSLIFYCKFPGSNATINKEQLINQRTYLRIKSKKGEKPFDVFRSRIDSIGKLLSLACPEYTVPHIIKGTSKNNKIKLAERAICDTIDIHYDVPVHKDLEREISFCDFLFLFSQIKNTFGDKFNNWLKICNELEVVIMLLFSERYNKKMYFEQKFLTLIQALEVYCRIRRNNEYLPKSEFNKRKKEILEQIPKEYHEWLNNQISNMPNLRARITDIISELRPVLKIPYEANFISKTVNTRNYLTHYSSNIRGHSADSSAELSALLHNLRMVLELLLLKEIGFSDSELKSIVSHRKFKSTLKLANRFLRIKH